MSIKMGDIRLLDVEEIKKILHLTPLTIRLYLKEGRIPGGQKIGKSWYVSKENLRAYLQGNDKEVTDSKEMPPEPK